VWAVAAPVTQGDRVVAALSIAGPVYRLNARARVRLIVSTRQAAADITARLSAVRI